MERARLLCIAFIWFDVSLHKATQVFTSNEAVYGEVRQTVMNKLGRHAHKFIDDLQL